MLPVMRRNAPAKPEGRAMVLQVFELSCSGWGIWSTAAPPSQPRDSTKNGSALDELLVADLDRFDGQHRGILAENQCKSNAWSTSLTAKRTKISRRIFLFLS
jgi:hypothetical protein